MYNFPWPGHDTDTVPTPEWKKLIQWTGVLVQKLTALLFVKKFPALL
jgi:hypothetical protein